nr:hypothetical protein [Tanacetum cinerariifolium]
MHVVHKHARVLVQWTFVTKINEEGKSKLIIWNFSKVLSLNSWTDIKNLTKHFSIYYTLLVSQIKLIAVCAFDLLDSVPELLHKDFRDFSRDSECLEAGRVLDDINDDLESFFLLWCSGLQSYIGGTNLDSFLSGNPFFITSSYLLNFFLINNYA